MALEIRQAQTYGISVKSSQNLLPADRFKYGYGIHLGDPYGGGLYNAKNSFILFVDSYDPVVGGPGNDHVYGDGVSDAFELVETFKLPGSNTIMNFCYGDLTAPGFDQNQCYRNDLGNLTTLNSIDISFVRPKPEAHITKNRDGTPILGPVSIILQSALQDKCKKIEVRSTGQISVIPNKVSCSRPYN